MASIANLLHWSPFWRRATGGFVSSGIVHALLLLGLAWFVFSEGPRSDVPELVAESVESNRDIELQTQAEIVVEEVSEAAASMGGSLAPGLQGHGSTAQEPLVPGVAFKPVPKQGGGGPRNLLGSGVAPEDLLNKVGERGANFFGLTAAGNDFIFIVDISGSMSNGDRIRRALGELRRSISKLAPPQRFFIIFFSDEAYPMPGELLVEPTKETLPQAYAWINRAAPLRGTNPLPAVEIALSMKPSAIFLLSDGEFDPVGILQEIQNRSPSDMIPIHTIAFESPAGAPMLQHISKQSNGKFRYVRP